LLPTFHSGLGVLTVSRGFIPALVLSRFFVRPSPARAACRSTYHTSKPLNLYLPHQVFPIAGQTLPLFAALANLGQEAGPLHSVNGETSQA
jgi:hypothetical protein